MAMWLYVCCFIADRTTSCPCLSQDLKFNVHAHPTLSEVLDELIKQCHVDSHGAGSHGAVKPVAPAEAAKQLVAA